MINLEHDYIVLNLIKLGLRPSEVYAITGVSLHQLRSLYHEIHNSPPPRGLVAKHVNKRISNMSAYYELIIFYKIFNSLYSQYSHKLNPINIINAYVTYKAISTSPLDFSTIYLAIKDIKTGWLKPKKCNFCKKLYLYNYAHHLMDRCPFCR